MKYQLEEELILEYSFAKVFVVTEVFIYSNAKYFRVLCGPEREEICCAVLSCEYDMGITLKHILQL